MSPARAAWPPACVVSSALVGQLMSMLLALPAVRVYTRALYRCIALTQARVESAKVHGLQPSYAVRLSEEAKEELHFWRERLHTHNGLPIHSRESQVEVLLWSDASDVGWGGEAVGVARGSSAAEAAARVEQAERQEIGELVSGSLPKAEIQASSTRRELVGLQQLVSTPRILQQVRGRRIKVFMDSIPALRNLINGGGPKEDLTAAVRDWTAFCEQHQVRPTYEWIPRAANWRADKASKLHAQQFTLLSAEVEARVREELLKLLGPEGQIRERNHWLGRVPLFAPMFHQVDARVEMIRAQLEEAIILVPEWPAGAMRRLVPKAGAAQRRVRVHREGEPSLQGGNTHRARRRAASVLVEGAKRGEEAGREACSSSSSSEKGK